MPTDYRMSSTCSKESRKLNTISNHSNWKGGLVNHSLKVYDCAKQIREEMILEDPSLSDFLKEEHIAVAALLHDICKIDEYKINFEGRPVHKKPPPISEDTGTNRSS